METQIYATYSIDEKMYNSRTFQAPNENVAKRIIKQAMKNDEMLKDNADNFDLYKLGTYNWEDGILEPDKKKICNVAELI